MMYRKPRQVDKNRRRTCFHIPITLESMNSNLDSTLSVKTVLKDLNLSKLNQIFDKEEVKIRTVLIKSFHISLIIFFQINLPEFFTLSEQDLISIGVEDEKERKKILDFITDFSTPKKPKRIPMKNVLFRN